MPTAPFCVRAAARAAQPFGDLIRTPNWAESRVQNTKAAGRIPSAQVPLLPAAAVAQRSKATLENPTDVMEPTGPKLAVWRWCEGALHSVEQTSFRGDVSPM